MNTKIPLLFIALGVLSGCVSVKPDLWKPLPNEIVVTNDITYNNHHFDRGTITLPSGHYVLKYQNGDGYYYALEGKEISEKVLGFTGEKIDTFNGGLHLWNRLKKIEVYQLMPLNSPNNKTGEVGYIAAWSGGEKDGNVRLPRSFVPEELWTSLKIEGGSMKDK